ncbi:MAG: hypothetical protein NC177_10650 [Ruminococcus flavefaciens]|nr:hypothetical protein [Ruminococcus flavefaciens]
MIRNIRDYLFRSFLQNSGTAFPRLKSEKSFVVSKETDIAIKKEKMFTGGAFIYPALFCFISDYNRKD